MRERDGFVIAVIALDHSAFRELLSPPPSCGVMPGRRNSKFALSIQ